MTKRIEQIKTQCGCGWRPLFARPVVRHGEERGAEIYRLADGKYEFLKRCPNEDCGRDFTGFTWEKVLEEISRSHS